MDVGSAVRTNVIAVTTLIGMMTTAKISSLLNRSFNDLFHEPGDLPTNE
jgi:hypothetical protein